MHLDKSARTVVLILGLFALSACFGYAYGTVDFDEKLKAEKLKSIQLGALAAQYTKPYELEKTDGDPTWHHVYQYQIFLPDSTYRPLEAEAKRSRQSVDALASQWIKDKFSELQKERAWR